MINIFFIFILVLLLILMIRYRATNPLPSNSRTARRQQFLKESKEKMRFLDRYKNFSLFRTKKRNENIGNSNNSGNETISQRNDCILNIATFDDHTNQFNRPLESRQMQISSGLNEDESDENEDFQQSINNKSSSSDSSDEDGREEESKLSQFDEFKHKLIETFIKKNINHTQGDAILNVLRSHSCFQLLPVSSKTLLKTPRKPISTISMGFGEYLHLGLEKEIQKKLAQLGKTVTSTLNNIIIDIHVDGMTIHQSTLTQIWPIQFRVTNIPDDKPSIIGIYVGKRKPNTSMEFLQYFINEFQAIRNGVLWRRQNLPIFIRALIADAPARALILGHRGHNASNACSKCKITGKSINRRMCFLSVNNEPRTDYEYLHIIDSNHHCSDNQSALRLLNFHMVSCVPFEYMHLICLGVVKKFITGLMVKKYSLTNLSSSTIVQISNRLLLLKSYCPSEFSRQPRCLQDYSHYKATEFRQILLYTGPVIFHKIINEDAYEHFLLLHSACRGLCELNLSAVNTEYAAIALKVYVECCEEIYGPTFVTYNVHGLLHVVDDVRSFGNLNAYSAFPYEDNMTYFRKYLRKPHCLLQQLHNRIEEGMNFNESKQKNSSIKLLHKHLNGPLLNRDVDVIQYKGLKFEYFRLAINNDKDNCIILNSGVICKVVNILKIIPSDEIKFVVKCFKSVSNFYNIPEGIDSSDVGVFKCWNLSETMTMIDLHTINAKCFIMPYWEEIQIVDDCFIVMKLLSHN